MTAFIVAAAILSAVVLAILVWPLLRPSQARIAARRADYDLGIGRDQLAEVERDLSRGLLSPQEAESARVEVKRRMLSALESAEPPPRRPVRAPLLVAALVLLLPLGAAGVYLALGAPGQPDRPLAERRAAATAADGGGEQQPVSLEQAAAQLELRLQERPDDAGGWFLLGRAYLTLGRSADAADALQRAAMLAPDDADVAAAHAEAVLAAAQGEITGAVRQALRRLLSLDPLSPQARYMLALDRAQNGDLPGAAQELTDLLALAPAGAPWTASVRGQRDQLAEQAGVDPASLAPSADALRLADAAAAAAADAPPPQGGDQAAPLPGPTAEDMAAAGQMNPEERSEMIRGMVDRLAARLQEAPDDLDGWRRLVRAYEVLGESEKAAEARARMQALERR